MARRHKTAKRPKPKTVLRFPDLEQSKNAVLNSLSTVSGNNQTRATVQCSTILQCEGRSSLLRPRLPRLRLPGLHVPMHSKWATRRHAGVATLAPRLKGLNITTDLMQVGKVVTGQQL